LANILPTRTCATECTKYFQPNLGTYISNTLQMTQQEPRNLIPEIGLNTPKSRVNCWIYALLTLFCRIV